MSSEPIFAFCQGALLAALEEWKAKQLAAYPHQRERIEITVLAMQDFLGDDAILRKHKLLTGTSPKVEQQTAEPAWEDPLGMGKCSP